MGARWLVLACLVHALAARALAQNETPPPPRPLREAVSLDTSSVVLKQLQAARDEFANGHWPQALDLLDEIESADEAGLVPVSPGRYVSVNHYLNLLLSTLPADGLAEYRKRVDTRASNWLQAARRDHDASALVSIVDRAFNSSHGDEALDLLAEWAWERGDIDAARACWMKIIPRTSKLASGIIPEFLLYPDTNLDLPAVAARLVLCSLAQRNSQRAQRELAIFRKLYPAAEGRLAGKKGKLLKILEDVAADARDWKIPTPADSSDFPTFAFNFERNTHLPEGLDVGSAAWSQTLPPPLPAGRSRNRTSAAADTLAYFPATYGDAVFVNSSEGIYAWNLKDGKPAWPDAAAGPLIYDANPAAENMPRLDSISGTPHYTISVVEGRLYARVGVPITDASNVDRLRGLSNQLVCLDLVHGEGKLQWSVEAGGATDGWMFAGSPLVEGTRLYCVLHKGHPRTEVGVGCYDCTSGELIWLRKVCATSSHVDVRASRIDHHLLTWGEGSLFLSTDAGAVAALDAQDGRVRWVVTYESQGSDEFRRADRAEIPCLYFQGLVIAAPRDNDAVLAIDAASGIIVWERRLRGAVDHLLGVGGESLVLSGDRLWGIDAFTGDVRWSVGSGDPATFGYGRGLLAAGMAYWPKRDELFIVDVEDGRIDRRVALSVLHDTGGGNLTLARGMLFIAGPRRLTAFDQYSRPALSDRDRTSDANK